MAPFPTQVPAQEARAHYRGGCHERPAISDREFPQIPRGPVTRRRGARGGYYGVQDAGGGARAAAQSALVKKQKTYFPTYLPTYLPTY